MDAKTAAIAERIAESLKNEDMYEALDALSLARVLVRADAARHTAQSNPESDEVHRVCL
jgi:hypothetical protein